MRLIDADGLCCDGITDYMGQMHMVVALEDIKSAPTINLWHYPSKGELPEKDGEYLVAWKSKRTGLLMYGIGLWELDRFLLNPQPTAWQYIVPPKEEA